MGGLNRLLAKVIDDDRYPLTPSVMTLKVPTSWDVEIAVYVRKPPRSPLTERSVLKGFGLDIALAQPKTTR